MEQTIVFTVNGRSRTVVTDPERPLLDVLREDLQLSGAKYGCGEGQCRACTVLLGGKSVPSCMTSAAQAHQQNILTIEGVASGDKLHPVQEAFLAESAMQCGFCAPGMIMTLVGLLNEKPLPGETEIMAQMERHLCRCCNYPNIRKAIKRVAATINRPAQ